MNDDAEIAELIDDFFAAMDEQDLERVAGRRDGRWVLLQTHLSLPSS